MTETQKKERLETLREHAEELTWCWNMRTLFKAADASFLLRNCRFYASGLDGIEKTRTSVYRALQQAGLDVLHARIAVLEADLLGVREEDGA